MFDSGDTVVCICHYDETRLYEIPLFTPIKILISINKFYMFKDDYYFYEAKLHKFISLSEYRKLKLKQLNNIF